MKKLIGPKKIKTAVFISGTGSNLKSLINYSLSKHSYIKINFVISDNSKAKGLGFATKHKIKKKIYKFNKRNNPEKKILLDLKKKKDKAYLSCWFYEDFIKKFY